jgi:hypothetical protein
MLAVAARLKFALTLSYPQFSTGVYANSSANVIRQSGFLR